MTQNGNVAGTPMFMSPEQAMGETLDHRSDQFSLGSVLYHVQWGQPPFRGKSTFAVLRRVVEETPQPIQEIAPETPQWLCEVIARLHAKNSENRFASAQEAANQLTSRLAQVQDSPTEKVETRECSDAASTIKAIKTVGRSVSRRWAAAAAVLMMLAGLGFTEASRVTDFRNTIIRIFSPEGTLIVEVDDPEVSVRIDGAELVISGAGVKEIRLKPGKYAVEAIKNGKLLSSELIAVTKNGRQVVRISQESVPEPRNGQSSSETIAGEPAEATLAIRQQLPAVLVRLDELNSELRGSYDLQDSHYDLVIRGSVIQDLSPLRSVVGLKRLHISVQKLHDLTPLQGLKLSHLFVNASGFSDLSPLHGMELEFLDLVGSKSIADLSPLKGMPLTSLSIAYTPVSDLEPLRGMQLDYLNCDSCSVSDLSPLRGMPLTVLEIDRTKVEDLAALKDMPLIHLKCIDAPVNDTGLAHLKGCRSLQLLKLKGTKVTARGIDELRISLPNCQIEWDGGTIKSR